MVEIFLEAGVMSAVAAVGLFGVFVMFMSRKKSDEEKQQMMENVKSSEVMSVWAILSVGLAFVNGFAKYVKVEINNYNISTQQVVNKILDYIPIIQIFMSIILLVAAYTIAYFVVINKCLKKSISDAMNGEGYSQLLIPDDLQEKMNAVMKNAKETKPLKTLDCVFSVSAIAIQNNKFLLVKRQQTGKKGMWVQPGSYYRTNVVFKSGDEIDQMYGKVMAPYDYLIEQLNQEANICEKDQFKFLDLTSSGITQQTLTSKLSPTSLAASTKKNSITPLPFLIQFEESERPKTSNKRIHIDLFYAIELLNNYSIEEAQKESNSNLKKYSEIKFHTLEEIKHYVDINTGEIYPDLYVICEQFLKHYRKYRFSNYKIRTCMFNNEQNSILIRVGDKCNLDCFFCIRNDEKLNLEGGERDADLPSGLESCVGSVLNYTGEKYKLIFSGGEPFLYRDLLSVISQIVENNMSSISSVSVCTNGTKWEPLRWQIRQLNQLCRANGIAFKFVIGLSWCSSDSFKSITHCDTGEKEVEDFVRFLNESNISFEISVVMTTRLKRNLTTYVHYWKDTLRAKHIALTYGCKRTNPNLLSKEECIDCYRKLTSGEYPIETFETLEFSIPDCDNQNCQQGKKMQHIAYDSVEKKWKLRKGCVEKIRFQKQGGN